MLAPDLSNREITSASPAETLKWEKRLRTACETLQLTPATTIRAMRVSGRIGGEAGQRRSVLALSRRMAEEYGLDWSGRLDGDFLDIRISR